MQNTNRISHFVDVPQNMAINRLYELDSRRTRSVEANPYCSQALLHSEKSNFKLEVADISKFQWVPSTRRLLATIREDYYHSHSDEIRIPVASYAERCNRKSIKELRCQLKRDLCSLMQIALPIKGSQSAPLFLKAELQNSYIAVKLSPAFVKALEEKKGAMQLPYLYFEICDKKFRYASDMLYYISLMRFVNNDKPAVRDHITIGKLLEVTALPSVEEVRQTQNGSIRERIIQPFFSNLHALSSELTYDLVAPNGFPISEADAQKLDFYDFRKVCIHFTWIHESELHQYTPKGKTA